MHCRKVQDHDLGDKDRGVVVTLGQLYLPLQLLVQSGTPTELPAGLLKLTRPCQPNLMSADVGP